MQPIFLKCNVRLILSDNLFIWESVTCKQENFSFIRAHTGSCSQQLPGSPTSWQSWNPCALCWNCLESSQVPLKKIRKWICIGCYFAPETPFISGRSPFSVKISCKAHARPFPWSLHVFQSVKVNYRRLLLSLICLVLWFLCLVFILPIPPCDSLMIIKYQSLRPKLLL